MMTMMLMMMIMIIKLKDETDATVAGDDNVVYFNDTSIINQMVDGRFCNKTMADQNSTLSHVKTLRLKNSSLLMNWWEHWLYWCDFEDLFVSIVPPSSNKPSWIVIALAFVIVLNYCDWEHNYPKIIKNISRQEQQHVLLWCAFVEQVRLWKSVNRGKYWGPRAANVKSKIFKLLKLQNLLTIENRQSM